MWAAALGSIAGSVIDGLVSKNNADNNIKMQKQFAQQGIQWKVADAQKAGIHPLAALGAQTTSFSPVSVGTNFSQAGQDIGRAMQSTQNNQTRVDAFDKATKKLTLERGVLENQLLASQVRKATQPATPPPMPEGTRYLVDGQQPTALTDRVKVEPFETESTNSAAPYVTSGAHPDVTFVRAKNGYRILPSKSAKELMEDNLVLETLWNADNLMMNPPRPPIPENKHMWYDYLGKWRYPRYRQHPRSRLYHQLRNHPARTGGPYR